MPAAITKIKSLTFVLASLLVVLSLTLVVTTVQAVVSSVSIRGNVNEVIPGPKLHGLANKQVTVTCGSVTKTATTSASGLYTLMINEEGCGPFSAVSTKATHNGSTITRQVFVSSGGQATIDLNF